jgi:hypothetical protein
MTVLMRRAIHDLDRASRRTLAAQINVPREDLADFAELPDFQLPETSMAALEVWWAIHQLRLILRDPSRTSHIGDICVATGVDRVAYDAFVAGEHGLSREDRDKLRSYALGRYGRAWNGDFMPPRPAPIVALAPSASAEMPEAIKRISALMNEIRTYPLHVVEELVLQLRQGRS